MRLFLPRGFRDDSRLWPRRSHASTIPLIAAGLHPQKMRAFAEMPQSHPNGAGITADKEVCSCMASPGAA